MFDNPIYNYSIAAILRQMGCVEARKNMFFSPFRNEKTASLHVDEARNLWYDHGAGIGGTNVQLVQLVKHCSDKEAARYICSLDPTLMNAPKPEVKENPNKIVSAKLLFSYYLKKYVESRKIPVELASMYVKEITVHNSERGQNFALLGFENNAGGYAMRAPSGFKSTNRSGITTINTEGGRSINASSASVAVFEGFFDFLSWMVMDGRKTPKCDVVVLNSVTNLDRASEYLRAHKTIECYLDRDDAGRACQLRLEKMFPDKEVTDMSVEYSRYKDLNEMLVAEGERRSQCQGQKV